MSKKYLGLLCVLLILQTACDQSQAVFNAETATLTQNQSAKQQTQSEGQTSQVGGTNSSSSNRDTFPVKGQQETTGGAVEIAEAKALTKSELIKLGMSFTVRVRNSRAAKELFDGSGVIVGEKEGFVYILTVCHAVDAGIGEVDFFSLDTFPNPTLTLTHPEVVVKSRTADLAVIRVKTAKQLPFAPVSFVKKLDKDPKSVYSVGCSAGNTPTLLPETLLKKSRIQIRQNGPKRFLWSTDSPQQQGRSGGPLISADGRLLGLALGTDGENGFYSHFSEIADYLIDSNLGWLVNYGSTGNVKSGTSADTR